MATTGDRVRRTRKQLGLTQTELANLSGITQPTISALEKNKSHTSGSLASIAKALGVNALWLETGRGNPQRIEGGADPGQDAQGEMCQHEVFSVSLIDARGSCGGAPRGESHVEEILTISTSLLLRYNAVPAETIALRADGDSMTPFIVHGDILFFDTSILKFTDGGIYLIGTPDGLRVKRVNKRADGRVILRSDSPDKARFPDEEYTSSQAADLTIGGRFLFRIGG